MNTAAIKDVRGSVGFSAIPLIWLSLFFAIGILLGRHFTITSLSLFALILLSTVAAIIALRHSIGLGFLAIAFIAAGMLSLQLFDDVGQSRLKYLYDQGLLAQKDPVEIDGRLDREPEPAPNGVFLSLQAESITSNGVRREVSGRVRVFVQLDSEEKLNDASGLSLRFGFRLRIACRPDRLNAYRNPGVMRRTEILDSQGFDLTASLKSPLLIEIVQDPNQISTVAGKALNIRNQLIEVIRERFDRRTAGILIASLLGNKHFLDKDTGDAFREGGTFHVLVISGLHITFIGWILFGLIKRFTRRRWFHFVFVSALLWIYTIGVGADLPVARATLMVTVALFGIAINRESNLANSFGASVLILLALRPTDLFAASFHLTVVSVGSIVFVAFPIIKNIREIGKWVPTIAKPFPATVPAFVRRCLETLYWESQVWSIARKKNIWSAELIKRPFFRLRARSFFIFVFESFLVSAIVQVSLMPLSVVYFHRFSVLSVFFNLWVEVVIAAMSFLSIFAVIISALSNTAAVPIIKLTEFCTYLLVGFPAQLHELFPLALRIPVYSGIGSIVYLSYFLPVTAAAVTIYKWNPFALEKPKWHVRLGRLIPFAASLILLHGLLIITHPRSSPRPDDLLVVEFIDVGQGDSALITFLTGETMLIDGGGVPNFSNRSNTEEEPFEPDIPSIGEFVVSEFLWEKGMSRIDLLVATHNDADHIQGLIDVAKNFEIGEAVTNVGDLDPEAVALKRTLRDRGVVPKQVASGDNLVIAGVTVEFFRSQFGTKNDQSIVVRLTLGKTKFLFTGDVESLGEQYLVDSILDLKADVIKVPHHGSRTSSTAPFVDRVDPTVAVISVAEFSRFGHPHDEVVERWRDTGAETFTTGKDGLVRILSNGDAVAVETPCREKTQPCY